jgi:hypothetical protein
MLRQITEKEEVAQFQNLFYERLRYFLPLPVSRSLDFPGGKREIQLISNDEIWYVKGMLGHETYPDYRNAFGLEGAHDPSMIIVEINIPISGISHSTSGLFARGGSSDRVYLLHRGDIEGTEDSSFAQWYERLRPSRWVEFEEGLDETYRGVLVGSLEGDSFFNELTNFIHDVAVFKGQITG